MSGKNNILDHFPLAKYHHPNVPDYAGNPLIEALPVFQSDNEVYQILRQDRPRRRDMKKLSLEDRQDLIYLARQFFKPYSQVMLLYRAISSMIRVGYVNRNPLDNNYWPGTRQKNEEKWAGNTNQGFQAITKGPFKSLGQTIIGIGGTGKTYAIESILDSLYKKQVIRHQKYRGHPFPFIQIV